MHTFCVASGEPEGSLSMSLMSGATRFLMSSKVMYMNPPLVGTGAVADGEVSERDDKYFASIGNNAISVYETETMGLLDKESMKVANVLDFSWSPTEPFLSLFVPEGGGGN
ncbi:unnamed protein product [Sphagnum balticum]